MRRVRSQVLGPVFRLVVVALVLGCVLPAVASAVPKAVLSSFGAPNGVLGGQLVLPRGVAVNQSGAGGVPVGSVYVAEGNTNHRISQYTAEGQFVRAWGFDVVSGNPETGFEVCTVAAQCKAGVSGVGAGQLNNPQGIAIDQSTGFLYVTSASNRRVDVFSATGQFAGAFGWGVDTGTAALEFCTSAPDRTCQAAAAAGAAGGNLQSLTASVPSIDPTAAPGTLYVPDVGNARVSRYTTTITGGVLTGVSFVKAFGWDVVSTGPGDDTTAPVNELENCVPANGDVCKAGLATPGGGSGQFGPANTGSPTASAVDSTGAVYVASGPMVSGNCTATNPCRIQKFASGTGSATNFGPTTGPGQIYFETGAANAVAALSIAVDPSNDHVYILRRESNTSYKVLEFDSAGAYIETHPGGAALTGATNNLGAGLAAGLDGRVYANLSGGTGTNQVNILGQIDPPEVTIEPVTGVGATTATFNASVEIPVPGAPTFTTVYRFEYSSDGTSWAALENAAVGDGSPGTHAVSSVVSGLEPNTLYLVRAVASTGAGDVVSSPTGFMTDTSAPRIELTYAEEVGQTEARLGAHIDPEGTPTSYHFEWGTQPCSDIPNPCTELPATPRALGAGNSLVIATEDIDDLDPESGYHYRVVATNQQGDTTTSEDREFETLNDCGLTDGRCYEMVSPPDKGPVGSAGDIVALGAERQVQVSPDGSAFQYVIAYGAADATSGNEVPYMARRGPGGWASTQLVPPTLRPPSGSTVVGNPVAYQLMRSVDLSCGVFSSRQKLADDVPDAHLDAGGAVLYRQDAAGQWTAITNLLSETPGGQVADSQAYDFHVAGVSQPPAYEGCRRVVFWDRNTYPGIASSGADWQLYQWEDGVLTNIGVVPGPGGPTVVPSAPGGAPYPIAIAADGSDNKTATNTWNAVSDDASRTYFTANSLMGGDVGRRAVFLYTIGDSAGVDVSQSRTAVPNDDDSIYQTASTDGSTMLFTARTGLATNDPALGPVSCSHPQTPVLTGASVGRGCDLYEYTVGVDGVPGTGDDTLVDLSRPEAGTTNNSEGAGVLGVLAASDDAKSVYFAARGQLVAGKGKTAAQNVAQGTFNVYLARGGELTYVSGLSGGDSASLIAFAMSFVEGYWSTRVTPDGDYLLLESFGNLTGYDSHDQKELYLFDATAERLECVSCRRDRKPPVPVSNLVLGGDDKLVSGAAVFNRDAPPRQISDDGSRIVFYSRNRLATGATEGRRNAYQWKDGQISLVASSEPTSTPTWQVPRFGGMSTTGDDLFVVTVDRLTWRDTDGKLDVYDARVGGGDGPEPEMPQPCDPLVAGDCQSGGGGETVGSVVDSGAERGSEPRSSRAVFSVGRLSAAQRAAIVSGRAGRLAVKVNQPGVVRVRGLARIGRKKVAVVSGRRRASSAGMVEVPIRLSLQARRALARNGRLQVSLTTSFSRSSRAVSSWLSLKTKPSLRRAGSDRGGRR